MRYVRSSIQHKRGEGMNCQRCGDICPAGAAFCLNCGFRFISPASSVVTPYSDLKKGLAIAALIIGILNILMFGLLGLGTVVGVIIGLIALNKARKSPSEYGGKGMAIAGLIMS